MEMFDIKDTFNKKIEELEEQIRKLKSLSEEKINEINQLNDKNHSISNLQKKTESELKSITEKLRNIEFELSQKINMWKKAKESYTEFINDKKMLIENNFPLKEYSMLNKNTEKNHFAFVDKIIELKSLNYKNQNLKKSINENPIKRKNTSEEIHLQNLNFLNHEYILKCYEQYSIQLKYFSSLINNLNSGFFTNIDSFLDSLIEHVNFLHSNVELKNEHRGYLYPLDKLKTHLFCLQQIIRSISFFAKILIKKIENLLNNLTKINSQHNNSFSSCIGNVNNSMIHVYTNLNIIIFLFNKGVTYSDLIGRYFSVMLREERKIVNIDADNDFFSNRMKINKNLKSFSNKFFQNLKIISKHLNNIFNFDINYHHKNFKITSDNSAMIIINVNRLYFKNLTFNNLARAAEGVHLFNKLFIVQFSKNFRVDLIELIKQFELKLELEYKMFEIIKEENKHKYNYPIINLSSLRLNNENLKKSLKEISQFLSQDLFTQILQVFKINSWEYGKNSNMDNVTNGDVLMSIFSNKIINFLTLTQIQQRSSIKTYLSSEPGIDYEEAIRNKNILREMLEKDNKSVKDKENYLIKLSEYEEDLKKLREQVIIQQNELDVSNLKLLKSKNFSSRIDNSENFPTSFSESTSNTEKNDNLSTSAISQSQSQGNQHECSLREFVKHGINISELPKEILSDDVQSGKQRSTFKLTDRDNKPIPLNKAIAKADDITEDINVLYHRKILEKIQKYTAKIKNIDVKVMANIQSEDIRREYDEKFNIFKNGYISQIQELDEQIKTLKISEAGYIENIEFLTNVMVDYEGLKENVQRCNNCIRYLRALETRK